MRKCYPKNIIRNHISSLPVITDLIELLVRLFVATRGDISRKYLNYKKIEKSTAVGIYPVILYSRVIVYGVYNMPPWWVHQLNWLSSYICVIICRLSSHYLRHNLYFCDNEFHQIIKKKSDYFSKTVFLRIDVLEFLEL